MEDSDVMHSSVLKISVELPNWCEMRISQDTSLVLWCLFIFFFSGGRKVWYDGKLKHGKALKMEWKVSGRGRVWILKAAFGT